MVRKNKIKGEVFEIKIDFEELARKQVYDFPAFIELVKRGGLKYNEGFDASSINYAFQKSYRADDIAIDLNVLSTFLKDIFVGTYINKK